MPRVKTGVVRRKRHNKVLSQTKGFWGTRSKLFRRAQEAFIRSGEHAFMGRKLRKRDMKKLWIMRINAGLKAFDIRYSLFIKNLTASKVQLDRKVLSELALSYPKAFEAIVKKVSK